jgi:hypothetical protein
MVFLHVQVTYQRRGLDPGGPNGGSSRYCTTARDHHGIRPDLFDLGVVDDLYSLSGEPAPCGVHQ